MSSGGMSNGLARVGRPEIAILVFSSVLILLIALADLWVLCVAYAGVLFACAVSSPVLGAAMWFIPVPFEAVSIMENEIPPFVFMTPAYLLGSLLWFVNRQHGKVSTTVVLYCLLVLLAIAPETLIGGGWIELRSMLSVVASLLVVVTALTAIENEPDKAQLIIIAALLSAMTSMAYALLSFSGGWRLTMTADWGGGARALDASIGMALACCLTLIFGRSQLRRSVVRPVQVLLKGRSLPALGMLLGLGLLATVSRGAILAMAVAVVLTSVLFMVTALYKRSIPSQVLVVAVGLAIVVLGVPYMDQILTSGQLSSRIASAIQDPGGNARWSIWQSGIASLAGREWLLGSGLGSFQTTTGWTPHSLYVGVLVEAGLVGLLVVIAGMTAIFIRGTRRCGLPFTVFFSYVAIAFATKGSLFDKNFYYAAVMAWALIETLGVTELSDLLNRKWRRVSFSRRLRNSRRFEPSRVMRDLEVIPGS